MKRLLPYLQLMRLPALFTAWSDCFAGLVMTHVGLEPLSEFVLLLLATTGLYLGGMVFNDVFDVKIDREERPTRPIPSGRVSLRGAIVLGLSLMGVGIACAAEVGVNSLILACLLTSCIFAYNGFLKKTWLGPFAMGGCRFLNIMLAASAIGRWQSIWTRPQLGLAIGIGIYIVGITIFARSEATRSKKLPLLVGMAIANAGIAVLIWLVNVWPSAVTPERVLIGLGVILLIQNRRWLTAVIDPTPERVQQGVRNGLVGLILLDALMIYFKTGNPVLSGATALLVIPSMFLGRWIPMT